MNIPNGFAHLSGGSTYLSENDIAKIQQAAPQPVQPAQPVQMAQAYYSPQPVYYSVQPQPQNYVFLPWVPPKKDTDSVSIKILRMEQHLLIDGFIKALNTAGVPWVDTATGMNNNGVQVMQPLVALDANDGQDNQQSGE
ncbi:hypothetical protein V4F18_001987 [Salmonella enterica]|nr:hypothetical protein [Salmonella enterica subsp. enterica serovar Poona]ELV6824682.1 hypothetical protein [Salmonella enterica]